MSQTITIDKQEYNSLLETNKHYRELLDTYDAIRIGIEEKKEGKLKKLSGLSSLLD